MPQTLSSQIVDRRGAFHGGIYNNGGIRPMQSTPSLNTQGMAYGSPAPNLFGAYGMPMQQQAAFNGMANPMGGYSAMSAYGAAPPMSMYGGGMMQPGMPGPMPMSMPMQLPVNGGSMDRVEKWRQGIS